MRRLISGTLALALAFPAVAIAQERHERHEQTERAERTTQAQQARTSTPGRQTTTSRQQSVASHKFKTGERFDRSRAQNYSRIDYRSNSRLSSPSRGYTWVRSGNDALLVRLSNNVVARVVNNVF